METQNAPQSLTEATVPARKSGSPAVIAKSDLSQPEADLLQQLKTIVHRGKKVFIEVGTALFQIKESRLYRSEFKTFEEFCQSEFGFSRNFADKVIISSGIASSLGTIVPIPNEGTAREFISVPAEDRPVVAERAKAIAAEHGRDTINSRDVREAKAKRKAGPTYHCTECNVAFTESEGDCPRCYPPEPETVGFVPADDLEFEVTFNLVCGSFRRRIFDARNQWNPEQIKRLKAEIDASFSCVVPAEYREAR